MGNGVSISVDGLEEVKKGMLGHRIKVRRLANDAIHKAGFFLQGEVKQSIAGRRDEPASVDTGHFLQSVETDNSQELKTEVKSDVSYAKFLEYGTVKLPERRHFRNTLDQNKKQVQEFVKEAVDQGLD